MSSKEEREEEEGEEKEGSVRVSAVFLCFFACEEGVGGFKASLAVPGGKIRKKGETSEFT